MDRLILKMKALGSLERSATIYPSTRSNISEDVNLLQPRYENLKSDPKKGVG
jgi:hypothetical protein